MKIEIVVSVVPELLKVLNALSESLNKSSNNKPQQLEMEINEQEAHEKVSGKKQIEQKAPSEEESDDEEFTNKKKKPKKTSSFDDEEEEQAEKTSGGFDEEESEESDDKEEEAEEVAKPRGRGRPKSVGAASAAKPVKFTFDDVNDACKARSVRTTRAEVLGILKKFKVSSVSELDETDYPAVIAAMKGKQ